MNTIFIKSHQIFKLIFIYTISTTIIFLKIIFFSLSGTALLLLILKDEME